MKKHRIVHHNMRDDSRISDSEGSDFNDEEEMTDPSNLDNSEDLGEQESSEEATLAGRRVSHSSKFDVSKPNAVIKDFVNTNSKDEKKRDIDEEMGDDVLLSVGEDNTSNQVWEKAGASAQLSTECSLCSKKFSSKYNMNAHKEKKKYRCDECGQKFCSNVSLTCHKKAVHNGAFKCSICGNKFAEKSKVKRHEKNRSQNPFSSCSSKFCNSVDLRNHVYDVHKCKVCSICGITYPDLNYHMKSVHEGKETV